MAEKFFQAEASKSGTYEFTTAGKFVDRNINLVVPAAEVIAQGGFSKTFDVVAAATVGEKNQVTNTYPVSPSLILMSSKPLIYNVLYPSAVKFLSLL